VTLQQAKNEVETNPTRAVARIRGLAAKHPRDVRSIGIAARAAGVAWALPGSKSTKTLQMSRDGTRVLSAGTDGVVRVYDLAKRDVRNVVEMGVAVSARWADGERRIVLWKDELVVVMAADGKDRREVKTSTGIADLEVIGMSAYWADDEHRLWSLDLAGTSPVELAMPEPIRGLAPSPDGRWIALAGVDHLMFFDRTQPTAEPVSFINGVTKDLDWSSDGKFLAALVDDNVLAIRVEAGMFGAVNRRSVGERRYVASANERAFSIGPTGVALVPWDSQGSRKPLVGDPINIVEARGGTFVAASQGGIAVLADSGDLTLTVPAGRVEILDASPSSPYVVATVEEHLIVWNLDELQPRRIDVDAPVERAVFVGNAAALASHASGPLTWIDLATGKVTALDKRAALLDVAGAPNGTLACVVDAGRNATLLAPGAPPVALDGTVSHVAFVRDRALLLADDEGGTLRLHDVDAKTTTLLVARKAKLVGIAWSRGTPTWIAAAFTDGTLWRQNLTTAQAETSEQPIKVTSGLLLLDDGTVMFGEGRQLRTWRGDGDIIAHAALPGPAAELGIAGTGPAIAITSQGATYLVALDERDRVTEVDAINAGKIAMSAATGTYVVSTADGFDVVDPIAKHRWTLGRTKGVPYRDPKISADGRRVLAHTTKRPDGDDAAALIVWTLPDPPSPDDTTAWLDAMTNAIIDPATGRLSWK
ncbi:MAG TPA: WD40 repeat domain-containing protein, partial [Kofleriaceae bacterium]|nr:WD40 repeat domain-containing protein [Kofleriaceae bacterium]